MDNQMVPWWLELSDTSKDGWLVDSWIEIYYHLKTIGLFTSASNGFT